ncbi:hypothetical protein TGAM01_v200325 [Trichoderma gamsii]|uniref:Uncharacterized protein n=1 Tax=Trichoderma gamsii TaxID=398673 RepID=A0A2P5A2Z6_9HYPO|nr:hypothetical protein TGAM01_v200325 [Trichoderma gamsii]PON30905.1 hypothetical protein TGAM01_v200325 [Trichoderma gamsii]
MKFSASSLLALTSSAAAFSGQFSTWYEGGGEGPGILHIYVTDYSTGSTYEGRDYDGSLSSQGKEISFVETSDGDYSWNASVWVTSDGCFNIDFQGAFGVGHGYCCGGFPCNLSA